MKACISSLAGLLLFTTSTLYAQQVIPQPLIFQDYQSAIAPGMSKGGTNGPGDSGFGNTWSLASSLVNEGANRYAHYVLTTTTLPSSPSTRWYGGDAEASKYVPITPVDFSPGFTVSFDIRKSVAEPVRVEIDNSGGLSGATQVYTAWFTPQTTDWSHVTLFSSGFEQTTNRPSSSIVVLIEMYSHDALGNPLAMAQNIGTYTMDIDNLTLEIVPEPCAGVLMVCGVVCVAALRRCVRRGE